MTELARTTDPDTSHEGVPDEDTRKTRCLRLLGVFPTRDCTPYEAGVIAGLEAWQSSKRVSDLKNSGYLAATGERRVSGEYGREHEVLTITRWGADVLAGRAQLVLAPSKKVPRRTKTAEQFADDLADALEELAPEHPLLERWDLYRNAL